jgi:hypothetical protein
VSFRHRNLRAVVKTRADQHERRLLEAPRSACGCVTTQATPVLSAPSEDLHPSEIESSGKPIRGPYAQDPVIEI